MAVLVANILLGVLTSFLALYEIANFHSVIGDSPLFSVGIGLYLLVAAGAAVALLSVLLHGSPVQPQPAPMWSPAPPQAPWPPQPPWPPQAPLPPQQPYPGPWQPPTR